MWKEQIRSLSQQFQKTKGKFQWREEPVTLASELSFPDKELALENGKVVTLSLAKPEYISQMVELENLAYHGVTMWGFHDF